MRKIPESTDELTDFILDDVLYRRSRPSASGLDPEAVHKPDNDCLSKQLLPSSKTHADHSKTDSFDRGSNPSAFGSDSNHRSLH